MRRIEPAGLIPVALSPNTRQQRSVRLIYGHPRTEVRPKSVRGNPRKVFSNVHDVPIAPLVDVHRSSPRHIHPLRLVPAVAVEHMHAMVLSISNVDVSLAVDFDVVNDVELPLSRAGLSPRVQVVAVRIVLVDVRVCVAVCDVDRAVAHVHCYVRRTTERLAAHGRRRVAGIAQRE